MSWPETRLDSWNEFTDLAAQFRFGDPFTHSHLARGQCNAAHSLTPSLNRLLPLGITEQDARTIEVSLLREFKAQARGFIPASLLPDDPSTVEWWALMQHHGVPTRLLDWTTSPYVAAYFAVVQRWDVDGAIWLVHAHMLIDALVLGGIAVETALDPIASEAGGPHLVSPAFASRRTDRMIAQQGQFTFGLNLLCDQERAMSEAVRTAGLSSADTLYSKVTIPRRLKPEFLDQLRAMNVSANALFPGLDGLGRSLEELLRIACFRAGEGELPAHAG
jgi:hypothetical protein